MAKIKQRVIDSDIRLDRIEVEAYIADEFMGRGIIEEIRDGSVRINGEWYSVRLF